MVKYFLVWDNRSRVWDVCQTIKGNFKGHDPLKLGSITEEELSMAIEGVFDHHKKVKALTDLILFSQSQKQHLS